MERKISIRLWFLFIICIFFFQKALRAQGVDSVQWARKQIFAAPSKTFIPPAGQSIPFVDVVTKPVVNVLINGKGPFRLLVDIGANITLLQQKVVEQLQLKNLRPNGGKLLLVDSINVGGAKFAGMIVGETELNENIDGVIGFNVFRDCLLTFDYPRQQLTIGNGELPETDNKTTFTYFTRYGLPYYTVKVGSDTLSVLLDTGMLGYFAINSAKKDRFKFGEEKKAVNTTSSYYKGAAVQTPLKENITIGMYTIANCPTVISVEDGDRIGSGIFQYFILTLDQKHKIFKLSGSKKILNL